MINSSVSIACDGIKDIAVGWVNSNIGNSLGPGEIAGEMSLLSSKPTSAEVRAEVESWVLRLSKSSFAEVTSKRPELIGILERVAEGRREPSVAPPAPSEVLV